VYKLAANFAQNYLFEGNEVRVDLGGVWKERLRVLEEQLAKAKIGKKRTNPLNKSVSSLCFAKKTTQKSGHLAPIRSRKAVHSAANTQTSLHDAPTETSQPADTLPVS